jgi:hypothetical protein
LIFDLFLTSAEAVQHGVEKLSRRATTLVETSFQLDVEVGRYELSKSRDSNPR